MKLYIYIIILFVFSFTSVNSQTVIPVSNLIGNITAAVPVTGDIYLITVEAVNDESLVNYDGTTIAADGTFVVWQNCKRYIVTNVTCATCYQFNTQVKIEVTADHTLNGSPVFGLITIIRETTPLRLGSFVSGSPDPNQQCISAYYTNKIAQVSTTGDNLGDHLAIDSLDMDGFDIKNIGSLEIDGVEDRTFVTTTTSITLDKSNNVIYADASGGDILITLPSAVGNGGWTYRIQRIDNTNNILQIGDYYLYGINHEIIIRSNNTAWICGY